MSNRSNSESVFRRQDYGSAFEGLRNLSPSAFAAYFDLLGVSERESGVLVDIGAGPGLQSELLAAHLPDGWTLVALEKSPELAALAATRLSRQTGGCQTQVRCVGFYEDTSAGYDAAWLSEVVHLLGTPQDWAAKLASSLNPGARGVVRTSTHEQLRTRQWYNYFPRALEVDLERHPSERAVSQALADSGFVSYQATTVDESRMLPATVVRDLFAKRAFSTLHLISARELKAGLALWDAEFAGSDLVLWDYEMTAYSFAVPRSEGEP